MSTPQYDNADANPVVPEVPRSRPSRASVAAATAMMTEEDIEAAAMLSAAERDEDAKLETAAMLRGEVNEKTKKDLMAMAMHNNEIVEHDIEESSGGNNGTGDANAYDLADDSDPDAMRRRLLAMATAGNEAAMHGGNVDYDEADENPDDDNDDDEGGSGGDDDGDDMPHEEDDFAARNRKLMALAMHNNEIVEHEPQGGGAAPDDDTDEGAFDVGTPGEGDAGPPDVDARMQLLNAAYANAERTSANDISSIPSVAVSDGTSVGETINMGDLRTDSYKEATSGDVEKGPTSAPHSEIVAQEAQLKQKHEEAAEEKGEIGGEEQVPEDGSEAPPAKKKGGGCCNIL
eukprot:m.182085 g.182085  ORF g.182085 m.182085 type:complete len:346 (-) comp15433_c0_seq1:135-1172(-)